MLVIGPEQEEPEGLLAASKKYLSACHKRAGMPGCRFICSKPVATALLLLPSPSQVKENYHVRNGAQHGSHLHLERQHVRAVPGICLPSLDPVMDIEIRPPDAQTHRLPQERDGHPARGKGEARGRSVPDYHSH